MASTQQRHIRRQVGALAQELSRLAIACDIELGRAELPERILRNDETVCGKKNPKAFAQLRRHLMALLQVNEKAIDNLGSVEAIDTLNEALAEVTRLRKAGSPNASVPRKF